MAWRRSKLLSKSAINFLPLVIIAQGAAAEQLLHGTFFLAGISRDYAVVSIDSRESYTGAISRTANDHYCKIRTLSDHVIFFATGTTSATSAKTGALIFDARDVAQRTFNYFDGDNFHDLTYKWATEMEAIYVHYVDSFPPAVTETVASGFFIGINSVNEIAASEATIFRRPDLLTGFAFHIERLVPGLPGNMPVLNNGHFEILEEFYGRRQTDRAKKIIAETAGRDPGPDTDASRYSSYVAAVRDWSGDAGIGGEVATIILERGKGWRWFHRPDFCPEK